MRKVWTEEEIDFIRRNKTRMTNKKLAKKLGCSESQLKRAIKKYRLKRTNKEQYDLLDNITGRKWPRPQYYHGIFYKRP
jgi:hypothetical protein